MAQKKPRRSRSELREMMLKAGKDVLFEIEPTLGFEQLTYSTVFEHLQSEYGERVTIGSVHERIWKSQRDYQLDVLATVLREPLPVRPNDALERAAAVIANADLSTPGGRRYALQSAIRLSSYQLQTMAHEDATNLAHTVRFRLWALGPDNPEAAGFTEAIHTIRQASTAGHSNVVRAVMQYIGLRVRDVAGDLDDAVEMIAILGNATTVGLLTDVLDASQSSRLLPTGPDGELEEWYPDARALWAHTQSMFELDGEGLTDEERRL